MDLARAVADAVIRRALGFAGLAVATMMLGLCTDAALSLRAGAVMVAATWLALLVAAHVTPNRDLRRTEFGVALVSVGGTQGRVPPEAARVLLAVMEERLRWHADRAALLAAALWVLGFGLTLLRA